MSDGFERMIATGRSLFAKLEQNNHKDWFDTHKATFKDGTEAPARLLVALFAEDLTRLIGRSHSGRLGRIYRDTRFSRDKTPYNTCLHACWESVQAAPGWLFRVTAQCPAIPTGLHGMDAAALARFRAAVDRDGTALERAIAGDEAAGAGIVHMGPEPLKRVPRPYPADHPHAAHLRRKVPASGLRPTDADLKDGPLSARDGAATALLPFWHWCDRANGGPEPTARRGSEAPGTGPEATQRHTAGSGQVRP